MITVGLDFGTHQTKVCIEDKKGVELNYYFLTFKNAKNEIKYTLPSIIGIDGKGMLQYGYLPRNYKGKIIKYFKQATFCKSSKTGMDFREALVYSILYIAYIIFDLEEQYGEEFSIQMGGPSDSSHMDYTKRIAVKILSAAYKLVEEEFKNDKDAFLKTDFNSLKNKIFLPHGEDVDEMKEFFQIRVFPEAYACLMPLLKSQMVANGMSLMIDLGGGTTDISFFTIKENKPVVYDFYSIPKGLNYLTDSTSKTGASLDSRVESESSLITENITDLSSEIQKICFLLNGKLESELKRQTSIKIVKLKDALDKRPLIYTGGGSTFKALMTPYANFKDVMQVSEKIWKTEAVKDMEEISRRNLCPILSTAYGLSISVETDDIRCEPFEDIFSNMRDIPEEEDHVTTYGYGDLDL